MRERKLSKSKVAPTKPGGKPGRSSRKFWLQIQKRGQPQKVEFVLIWKRFRIRRDHATGSAGLECPQNSGNFLLTKREKKSGPPRKRGRGRNIAQVFSTLQSNSSRRFSSSSLEEEDSEKPGIPHGNVDRERWPQQ